MLVMVFSRIVDCQTKAKSGPGMATAQSSVGASFVKSCNSDGAGARRRMHQGRRTGKIHICVHTCVQDYTYVCIYVCIVYACIHVCKITHMCVYMCVSHMCASCVILGPSHRADALGRFSHDDCWKRQLQRQGGQHVPRG